MVYNRVFLLFFCIITCVFSSTTYAQTQKHNIMVGGNASFEKRYRYYILPISNSQHGIVNNTFNLNPTISYFVVDNLALGLSVNFRRYKAMDTDNGEKEGDGHSYSIGPIVRYYFPFNNWAIFPEAQFLKVSGVNHSYSLQERFTNSSNGSAYKLGVGASYFVTPNVGMEGLLRYSYEYTSLVNNFYVGSPEAKVKRAGINLSIGIQFYLPL
jgi:outer membrane protein W